MMLPAWDKRTGKKLPYLVPESHFDHPVFSRVLLRRPPKKGRAPAREESQAETDTGDTAVNTEEKE